MSINRKLIKLCYIHTKIYVTIKNNEVGLNMEKPPRCMPFNKIQLNSEYSIFPLELKRKQKLYITHIYLPTGCRSKENVCQHTQNLLLAFASKKD